MAAMVIESDRVTTTREIGRRQQTQQGKQPKKEDITTEKRKPFEYNNYYIPKLLETQQQNSDGAGHRGLN